MKILDASGAPLQIGAMYVCVTVQLDDQCKEYDRHDGLVRYVGGDQFVDADSLEDCVADYDKLVRQACRPLSRSVLIDLGVPAEAIDAEDEAEVERRAALDDARVAA